MSETMTETPPDEQTEPQPDENEQGEAEQTDEQTDEPGQDDGAEPEQAPEQVEQESEALAAEPEAQPLSEKELDKLLRALGKEAERHAAAVSRIMGEDALALVKCEACDENIPGFHWPADSFAPDAPERTLYELLSGGADAQMRHPDYLRTCDECNGFGSVLTGARTDLTRTIPCPRCKTAGYLDAREQTTREALTAAVADALPDAAPEPAPQIERDFCGRPPDHPRYGKLPLYLTAAEWDADHAAGFDVGDRPGA